MWRTQVIDELSTAESLQGGWDALAVARARPFSSPGWMLAWWRQARPRRATLRIVAVWEDDELAGVLPFFAERTRVGIVRYRLLASTIAANTEPLAKAGSEPQVASLASEALAAGSPTADVISFHGLPVGSPWPALLGVGDVSPRGARVWRGSRMRAPRLTLEHGTYDDWFADLSRHRRAEFRRRRRRLEERGAVARLAESEEEVVAGLRDFAMLHHERWERKGGSGVLTPRIEAMLADAAHQLAPLGRLRLWSIEAGGDPVSSHLFVGAGGTLSYWLGGFDPRWAPYGPAIETVRAAIQHAWTVGDRVVDLGPGGQNYKYTFADGEDAVENVDLAPRSRRLLRTQFTVVALHTSTKARVIRQMASRRLSPRALRRLKAIRGRLRARR